MEKQKRWQLYLILAVLVLTLYNILPTIFYYTKPLKSPVDAPYAEQVAIEAVARVNSLEEDSVRWIESFSKLLGVKPTTVAVKNDNSGLVEVTFKNSREASLFRQFLPKAGALIPFAPAQLGLFQAPLDTPEKVLVQRQINVAIKPEEVNNLFKYAPKREANGEISPLYRELAYDRVIELAGALGGSSKTAQQLEAIVKAPTDNSSDTAIIALSKEIVDIDTIIGQKDAALATRYYQTFAQTENGNPATLAQQFLTRAEALKTRLAKDATTLVEEQTKLKAQGLALDPSQESRLALLNNQKTSLENGIKAFKKNSDSFKAAKTPLTRSEIAKTLASGSQDSKNSQVLSLEGRNPFVEALVIDWENGSIKLRFYPAVQKARLQVGTTEADAYFSGKLNQFIINDIARASRLSDETISPSDETFSVALNAIEGTESFLSINLGYLAEKQASQIAKELKDAWNPQHVDLKRETYPIMDYAEFLKASPEEQKLGLVVYAPSASAEKPPQGFRAGSIYVIARGLYSIAQKHEETASQPTSQQFTADANQLKNLLQQNGFIGYPASSYAVAPQFSKDYIFELSDYYSNVLKATREDFTVKGSKRFGVLDFTDVEQRILTRNKIDNRIQEDLLKWKEEYGSAQVDLNVTNKYLVPKPTKNVYWENFKLSFAKYFRGDERKILKWGLDLSGGKTVRIGLRDHNNKVVTNPDDLKQVVNELYTRINKMGLSERTIHIENNNIILDFPGSQGLSAAELVKASTMYFHIANEKFSPSNAVLKDSVDQFLQEVWNEAVVTNRKDIDNIQEIAWQHLGGSAVSGQETRPQSDVAKQLWDSGLRLADPKNKEVSAAFNDSLSAVAMLRGNDFMEWDGHTHPLMFVFHNYALEGSSLDNVNVGYDPTKGNTLNFGIRRSYQGHDRTGSPRDDLYNWTSQFAKEKIGGTPKEAFTQGRGWRMAVILNGLVITKPNLDAPLRDGGQITGRFSQREINQLAADLKAGSLSFTPKILSEQNVSPELGKEERTSGIVASSVAVALVVIAMVGYYKFAGVVASIAVLFNLLIMWGVLQNLGAALTLPTIAGIVLTIGMAVDANVLVFERIREEFAISGRIASAIQTGYRKAFTAIFDSNITTIIAAVILIQFDSGPIKGFAVSLIIGIVSSMFTALFMTRYFFAGWVQNPANKKLTMSQFIGKTHFNFMAQTRKAVIISVVVMVLGSALFIAQRNTMLGMDFTGGYALVVDLKEKVGQEKTSEQAAHEPNYRLEVADALLAGGATRNDFQVRELSRPNQIRMQFGISMEEKDHPFYNMPETADAQGLATASILPYQSIPRLNWVVETLKKGGLEIQTAQLETLERNWTVMSGQLSQTMRNNAILALGIALLSILLYITIRFEFNYAIGAVVGLVHDVIITLGILAMFHKLGFAVQIDLQVIGAIMTIIGYSLNDTIIVFDRIREDTKLLGKKKFVDVINEALNITLSRTLMTSGTTLLVLLALVFLGGQSIFAFSLVMTIGVFVGTLSSLFIASPVMLYFHNRALQKQGNGSSLKAS